MSDEEYQELVGALYINIQDFWGEKDLDATEEICALVGLYALQCVSCGKSEDFAIDLLRTAWPKAVLFEDNMKPIIKQKMAEVRRILGIKLQ